MITKKNKEEAKKLIEGAEKIGLVSHVRMDPDSYGCLLGLQTSLEKMGKKVVIFSEEEGIPSLKYFHPGVKYSPVSGYQDIDIMIICDTAIFERIAAPSIVEKIKNLPGIVIDHHVSEYSPNKNYIYLVEKRASASEICYEFLRDSDFLIDKRAAGYFYLGLSSDTGGFVFNNVTPKTLIIADEILGKAFKNTKKKIEFAVKRDYAEKLSFYEFCWKKIQECPKFNALIVPITQKDLKKFKMPEGIGSQVSNYIEEKGEKNSFVLMEIPGGKVKASLRSNKTGLNVREIAEKFGGGGHDLAAGCTINGTLEEAIIKFL